MIDFQQSLLKIELQNNIKIVTTESKHLCFQVRMMEMCQDHSGIHKK